MIYTTGYSKKWTPETLLIEAKRLNAIVLDIRLKPYCSWNSEWNGDDLRAFMGKRWYFGCPALGNRNYKGGPIEIADKVKGMEVVEYILQKDSGVILLCACSALQGCHRQVVAELLKDCLELDYEEISPPSHQMSLFGE